MRLLLDLQYISSSHRCRHHRRLIIGELQMLTYLATVQKVVEKYDYLVNYETQIAHRLLQLLQTKLQKLSMICSNVWILLFLFNFFF